LGYDVCLFGPMTMSPVLPSAWDVQRLVAALGQAACRFDIDVLAECQSTNGELLLRAEAGAPSGTVVVAERQTAGRGRRGRAWISSPGDSVTFSLLWRFSPGTLPLGLSLAVGVAVVRALEKMAAGDGGVFCRGDAVKTDIRLKWPNDILLQGKKLGGILVELVPGVPQAAVIGIGLNLHLPDSLPQDVRATAAAWPQGVDVNAFLAALLTELLRVLETFAHSGFASLRQDWSARHAFADAEVVLLSDFAAPLSGICRGVDEQGALLLEVGGKMERILSGEVSLREATTPDGRTDVSAGA
jgi:BirA family biotin operon repressor/biotin-[acetyl-CoA-carboxylase] ligase